MVARGFDGHARTLGQLQFSRRDALFIAVLGTVLVSISLINLVY